MKKLLVVVVSLLANILLLRGTAAQEQCGKDVGGKLCAKDRCCSKWGFCGKTEAYCGDGCQSGPCWTSTPHPTSSHPDGDITDLIPSSLFEKMLPHRNDNACPARGFYTYDAFITAARSFPAFATTGNTTIRKRELAAFFAHTSHETTGGWPTAPGGPYSWGYCFLNEIGGGDFCDSSNTQYPCAPGKQYYGRGPIQLSWNFNYGQCGEAIGEDLLNNPDLVATDPVIAFKTALWVWMTPQAPNPSCHDVMNGTWTPSPVDIATYWPPGFGLTINILSGGFECGRGENAHMLNRIGFYERYCSGEIFDVSPGDNVDCANQRPIAYGLILLNTM